LIGKGGTKREDHDPKQKNKESSKNNLCPKPFNSHLKQIKQKKYKNLRKNTKHKRGFTSNNGLFKTEVA
jgi:hypothetical protein